jgi:hypothetical protein
VLPRLADLGSDEAIAVAIGDQHEEAFALLWDLGTGVLAEVGPPDADRAGPARSSPLPRLRLAPRRANV